MPLEGAPAGGGTGYSCQTLDQLESQENFERALVEGGVKVYFRDE